MTNLAVGGVSPRVLVVDDDRSIRSTLERGLTLEGFDVRSVGDGESALAAVAAWDPNLIVLDVTMPGMDGVEVCQRIRSEGLDVPICMLSARDEVTDRVSGLKAGADDYLVKPFALAELEARLEALMRRSVPEGGAIDVGPLSIDPGSRQVICEGHEVELTRREFDLLLVLAGNDGIVLDRQRLLSLVWGYDFEANTNVVDVFVGYLRKKLEAEGQARLIHTVRGVGFVLRP